MNQITKANLLFAAMFCAVVCVANVATACPTCKDGMAGDPAYSNMVNGYFWSIIFMMSMPFLVFTGVAGYFYYEVCRARTRQAATASATLPNELTAAAQLDASNSGVGQSEGDSLPDIALQS